MLSPTQAMRMGGFPETSWAGAVRLERKKRGKRASRRRRNFIKVVISYLVAFITTEASPVLPLALIALLFPQFFSVFHMEKITASHVQPAFYVVPRLSGWQLALGFLFM